MGVRLPLGPFPDQRVLQLRCWIELIHRIIGRPHAKVAPQYFWSPGTAAHSNMTLFFNTPQAAEFENILHPDLESDSICDIRFIPESLDSIQGGRHAFVLDLVEDSPSLKILFDKLQSVRKQTS